MRHSAPALIEPATRVMHASAATTPTVRTGSTAGRTARPVLRPPEQRRRAHRRGEPPHHPEPRHRQAGEPAQPLGEGAGPDRLAVHRGVDAADGRAARLRRCAAPPTGRWRGRSPPGARPSSVHGHPGPDGLHRLLRPLLHVLSGGGVISTSTRASTGPPFRRPCELPAGHNTASPSRSSCCSPSTSTVGRPSRTTYTLSDDGVGVRRLGLAGTEAVHVEEEPLGGEEVVLLELRLGEAAGVREVLDLHGALI